MDRIALINSTVNTISALDYDMRIAIAHRLLMELEKKKDITRWQFWERQSVKEHAEEIAEKTLSETKVDTIINHLNEDWNNNSSSFRDTEEFTDAVGEIVRSFKKGS